MTNLSVVVITLNEEKRIIPLLESIKWVDEIVVVDSGSTDKTVDICKEYNAKVYSRKWEGYGPAKNYAIEMSTGKWILWLDADEEVTVELKKNILNVITDQEPADYYIITYINIVLGRHIKHCGWIKSSPRLFKRGHLKFGTRKVHEQISTEGVGHELRGHIYHRTYLNITHYFTKFNVYTTLEATELRDQYRDISNVGLLLRIILSPLKTFVNMYFVKLGFLDGIPGLFVCITSSLYHFISWLKYYEFRNQNS
jgi:glycosyltransferase involved in cell wall biosynthesis